MSFSFKTYLKYILISLCVIVPFASFQFFYVYGISSEEFSVKLVFIPLFIATIFGSLVANAVILRHKLRQTQDDYIQQAKMASLGHLVRSVAHEVNTPVGNTITLLGLLKKQKETIKKEIYSDSPQQTSIEEALEDIELNLTVMENSMKQVATLVRNFKTISIDNSDDLKSIDMYAYIESLLGAVQIELRNHEIEVSTRCDKEISIITYPSLLLQILSQCIYNAIHHAFENIKNPQISLVCYKKDLNIIIEIADNGTGIPKQLLPKIFDPFTMKTRKEGRIGLGLAMVYNIITENLHGEISVKSDTTGTLFRISLPEKINH